MKRAGILIAVCLFFMGLNAVAYCQDETQDEAMEEQSESAIGQNLESEIASDQAESNRDMGEMEESMDTGGATNY